MRLVDEACKHVKETFRHDDEVHRHDDTQHSEKYKIRNAVTNNYVVKLAQNTMVTTHGGQKNFT